MSSGRCESGLLAPETERFLRGAVGVAEEHAIGGGREPVRFPRGNDENVVRRELEMRRADVDASLPYDDTIDRAVGAAAVPAREPLRQLLHERSHGRKRVAAGDGVRVA